jgi:hypothetical protein
VEKSNGEGEAGVGGDAEGRRGGEWIADLSFRYSNRAFKDGAWASPLERDGQWKEEEAREGGEKPSVWWRRRRSCRTGLHTIDKKRKDKKNQRKREEKVGKRKNNPEKGISPCLLSRHS